MPFQVGGFHNKPAGLSGANSNHPPVHEHRCADRQECKDFIKYNA